MSQSIYEEFEQLATMGVDVSGPIYHTVPKSHTEKEKYRFTSISDIIRGKQQNNRAIVEKYKK